MVRPALFVGSSSEGLRIAQTIQVCLDPVSEVELWTQGIFGLTGGTLESLILALPRFDFRDTRPDGRRYGRFARSRKGVCAGQRAF
jgi:predicted nucleotide-binding protein